MKVWASIHKNNKVITRCSEESDLEDISEALLACLEKIYKELDIAEPVWVTKHAKELSRFGTTKFYPSDFIEPVSFDYFEVEYQIQ